MADRAPEQFSGTADRIKAATLLRDRFGVDRKIGPDLSDPLSEAADGDLSDALVLLLRWTSADREGLAEDL
jgi:hypothetical protein